VHLHVEILEYIERHGKSYSVDIAETIDVRIGRVSWALRSLEKQGLLKSHLEPSPKSGHGRRYYELVEGD